MEQKCTVLVCSCDAYSDLWEPFFRLFKEYWPDCAFNVVLNTETKICPGYGVDIKQYTHKNMASWPYGKRMRYFLKKIKTPYTMILLDDFFLRKTVETDRIYEVINWLDKDDRAVVFSFQNVIDPNNIKSEKYNGFCKRPNRGEYKFNFQAAIWKTKKLRSFWKDHESPWQWEVIGNHRSGFKRCTQKYDFYVLENDSDTPVNYGFDLQGMGVYRGKWCSDVTELFASHNIAVDYSKRGFYNPQDQQPGCCRFTQWDKLRSWGLVHYMINCKTAPWANEVKWLIRVVATKIKEHGFWYAFCRAIKRIFKRK